MELAEIVTALATHVGDDKEKAKAVRDALRAEAAPEGARLIAQSLIEMGAGRRASELQPKLTKAEADLATANATITTKDEEIQQLQAKAPNAAEIEARLNAAHDKKLKAEKERADNAEKRARELNRQVARDLTIAHLTKPGDDGVYVEPEHAKLLMDSRDADGYFVDKADGSLDLVNPEDKTSYDGKDVKEKAAALARDIRKKVQQRNLITSVDSGGGIRSGTGGQGSHDPVKAGKELAAAQKKDAKTNDLAFS